MEQLITIMLLSLDPAIIWNRSLICLFFVLNLKRDIDNYFQKITKQLSHKVFFLHSDVYVNWTDGTEICRRTHRNAQLVAIETEAEQEYLKAKWMVERGQYLRFSYLLQLNYIVQFWKRLFQRI